MRENRCIECRWLVCGMVFVLGAMGTPAGRRTAPPLPPLKPHPTVALTFDDLPAAGGLSPDDTRTRIASTLAAELMATTLLASTGL